jgi:hypothetical protein
MSVLLAVLRVSAPATFEYQQLQVISVHEIRYPPGAALLPNPIVCEFTGVLERGVIIRGARIPGHYCTEFPSEWFQQTIKAIRVSGHKGVSIGRFQLRLSKPTKNESPALVPQEGVSLWLAK